MPEVLLNWPTVIGGQFYEAGDVVEVYDSEARDYTELTGLAEVVEEPVPEETQQSSSKSKSSKSSQSSSKKS